MTTGQMSDVRLVYDERIESARQALSRGERPAAAAAFHSAIEVARGDAGLQGELVLALVQLGKLEQELGRPLDAERLLAEALETGERISGGEHVSLGPVLNELSRLYIRQSDHARAEAVLERLLRIMRTKGEDHPDVATALTGLALVKRALGDDVAAEQRFRDALRIREQALAPQHMATVATMEQLAETCAARGNLAEALALLQRALPTREAALGADHATVRALRSRIDALEHRAAPAVVTPAEEEAPPALVAVAAQSDVPPSVSRGRKGRRRIVRFASFGAIAIALATAGLSVGTRGRGSDAASGNGGAEPDAAAVTTPPSTNSATLALAMPEVERSNAARPASETPTSAAPETQTTTATVTPPAPPKLRFAPKALAAVTARLIAKTNADSLVRASTKVGREFLTDQIGTSGGLQTSPHLDDASAKPATLVGPAPTPRFPDDLRSHWSEGEVVVRFRVDERGRVDLSSVQVVKSDHDLFTSAVRNVLPRFRFEPARSAAPESKPIADWVDYRVRFAATK